MFTALRSPTFISSWTSMALTSVASFLGLSDARFSLSDLSFEHNPFWTSYLLTIVVFPCLFYLTWYLNPSLSKNRLGLSWILGFYSAALFTLAGLYEVPHLRTIFNSVVDYHPVATSTAIIGTVPGFSTLNLQSIDNFDTTFSAAKNVCCPLLKAGALALMSTLPSFLRLEPGSYSKYYCFSDFESDSKTSSNYVSNSTSALTKGGPFGPVNILSSANRKHTSNTSTTATRASHESFKESSTLSLRHRVYQGQMKRPHLFFSLENYPDDGRIGPHIIAANFQAFLVLDLILGFIHYRRQLEPFSTVAHHIIYYFIVVHMRAADMLSVFCICGTPIEASSIFLAFGRIFPHRRTPTTERLYLACFISTRLAYVALLWHEIYFNYPDKSVSFLYTITISLHVYWFVLYIKTQRRFQAKQRRQQLSSILQSLANSAKEEPAVTSTHNCVKQSPVALKNRFKIRSDLLNQSENRLSVEVDEIEFEMPHFVQRISAHGGAQLL